LGGRCPRVALKAFENRQGAILPVLTSGKWVAMNNYLLKSRQHSTHPFFEWWPVAISPILKSLQQIQKLNDKELINSV
jgi:hypothetical protein